jgi:hypothetical protein
MVEIASSRLFAASSVQPEQLSLDEVRRFCLDAYHRTNDFTLLHAVTSTHAFRLIQPYLSDSDISLRYHWQAILAAALSTRLLGSKAQETTQSSPDDWSACFSLATRARDDHQIKITYTCWQESLEYSDALYLEVARRANRQRR